MTYEIHIGDCLETLRGLPDQSVNCCVTSPPYFGLRDYDVDGQIGLEDTPDAYVAKLVEVFREVRRVLRDDGTLWLNLGDSYAQQGGRGEQGSSSARKGRANVEAQQKRASMRPPAGLKPKDLIGVPWMVAFALRADAWYLRQDIIWSKPNPMPESVKDRCTKAHEYLFLLSKGPRYYFDATAIAEPSIHAGRVVAYDGGQKNLEAAADPKMRTRIARDTEVKDTRNRRSVWTVSTKPFAGAHFATFPPDLIEPCILAGCPRGGTVLDPFGGSGTTAGVAVKHGRRAILCELNPKYVGMIRGRVLSIAGDIPDMLREAAE